MSADRKAVQPWRAVRNERPRTGWFASSKVGLAGPIRWGLFGKTRARLDAARLNREHQEQE